MLITCPTCASSYRIDATKIGPEGRSVRCAACREPWFLTPEDVLAAQAAELEAAGGEDPAGAASDPIAERAWAEAAAAVRASSEETSAPEGARSERRPRGQARKGTGKKGARSKGAGGKPTLPISPALALGLSALAALPIACLARSSIVAAVPQTASLFATIGLPVNLRGLEIRDVVAFQNPAEDGRPAELVVEGDLVGVGRADVPVPTMAVEIRDAAGRAVTTFPAAGPRALLGPGETARFRARLADPPAQGRAVELRFADAAPSRTAEPAHD